MTAIEAHQLPVELFAPAQHERVPMLTSDGRALTVRHIVPHDTALLVDLFYRMSDRTRTLRFFRPLNCPEDAVWREATRLSNIDPRLEAALVATAHEEGQERAIGVARLVHDPSSPQVAEVAIVVRDDYQAGGVGTTIINLLVQVAQARGITTLRAYMLAENRAVRRLIRRLGLTYTTQTSRGETLLLAQI